MQRRLKLLKIKDILRLSFTTSLSQNQIALALGCSKGAVNQTLKRFNSKQLSWPLPDSMQNADLMLLLYGKGATTKRHLAFPNLDALELELDASGASIQRLYEDYLQTQPNGFKRSRFFEIVRAHLKTKKIHLRMDRKPGEKLFIDFAGTMLIIKPSPHVTEKLPLFICSLGVSGKTFAIPLKDQTTTSVLDALAKAIEFFGGCSKVLVPDNMKSMVINASLFNPTLNELASQFCRHYNMVLLPARPYKPRDKALVECSVRHLGNLIFWRLRKVPIDSLERAQRLCLDVTHEFNEKVMPLYKQSRDERFLMIDKPRLQALPTSPFELIRIDKHLRAGEDYHVRLAGNFYSVPYALANTHVDAYSKKNSVEFYIDGARIATHILSPPNQNKTVTNPLHMSPQHASIRFYAKAHRLEAAKKVGEHCLKVAEKIFRHSSHEELGARRCRHLLILGTRYSAKALEKICAMALSMEIFLPTDIEAMLQLELHLESATATKTQQGQSQTSMSPMPINSHLRGKAAFIINNENQGEANDRTNST
jgi:transposase